MKPSQPPLLRLLEGEISLGERKLFSQADFRLSRGERAVLVGPNGAGKSTLFKALARQIALDGGRLELGGSVFYLPQDFAPPVGMVLEVAYHHTPLFAAQQALEQATPEQMADAWERVRSLEHWKSRVGKTLLEFGLDRSVWSLSTHSLSGGQGVRLGLALAFLSGAEILLLDEPTTHLDLRMRLALEQRLLSFGGALGLVTHDRALMQRLATTVYHLEAGRLLRVVGGYSVYLQEKDRLRRTLQKQLHEGLKERDRLLQALPDKRRPGRDRRKAERLALQKRAQRIATPDPLPPERRWSLEIAAEGTPKLVAVAEKVHKSYAGHSVIAPSSFRIFRGDRIGLVGPNGAGKTTLLRLLLSREPPDGGRIERMPGVRSAYLDQHWHGLEGHQSLWEQFTQRFGEARAQALLGRMGFRAPRIQDPPQRFSGGERARAGLALLGGLRAGLLVLDEPTNHLELELLEALERSLTDYPGTLLFVSHDRELLRKVATRFWGLEDGVLVEYPSYTDAEAAMLGEAAQRLNPFGQEEESSLSPEPTTDPEELRMELRKRLENPQLTDRERNRVRASLFSLEEALGIWYAQEHFCPAPYRHRSTTNGVEVFADHEGELWQFWSRGTVVYGELQENLLRLEHKPPKALLKGVLHIAFELLDCKQVHCGNSEWHRRS